MPGATSKSVFPSVLSRQPKVCQPTHPVQISRAERRCTIALRSFGTLTVELARLFETHSRVDSLTFSLCCGCTPPLGPPAIPLHPCRPVTLHALFR